VKKTTFILGERELAVLERIGREVRLQRAKDAQGGHHRQPVLQRVREHLDLCSAVLNRIINKTNEMKNKNQNVFWRQTV
jgi:hypothetical protein